MPRNRSVCLVLFLVLGVVACGGQPEGQRPITAEHQDNREPLPTRSTSTAGDLDLGSLFPEYEVSFSGPYWVQLNHREIEDLTFVVGVEPTLKGGNLQEQLQEHREEMDHPPGTLHRDSGNLESEGLGSTVWSWGTIDVTGAAIEQLALFAAHPVDSSLLIARSEFPSQGNDIEVQLAELLRIAEIVGPTL